MFGNFLGKATHNYNMDVAREIVDSTISQLQKVKTKSQKLVKCGHVWVGLFRQTTASHDTNPAHMLDVSSLSNPSTQAIEAANLKKRKMEEALVEQESKKSRSASTSLSIETKKRSDTLQKIMDKKKKEMELKVQTTSQHSSKQDSEKKAPSKEEEVSQGKQEEVSQGKPVKPLELSVVSVKPPKPVEILLHPKSMDALQELHQMQTQNLRKQRMAPIPLNLDQQFNEQLPYADIPIVVPRATRE